MSLDLSIPTTSEVHSPGKPHTLYHILLRLPIRSFTVYKRYSDFLTLHTSLTTLTGTRPPASPPSKSYIYHTVGNPILTSARRAALESYLRTILTHPDSRWRDTPAWRTFLNLPASYTNPPPAPASASTSASTSNPPITDPTLWLDSHRELKAQLHEARINLSKREQATTPTALHESSAASKRNLMKSSALINALDAGLKDVTPPLLEGELRRRRDLVAAARKERDGLEALASTMTVKRQTARDPAVVATNGQKLELFNGRGGGGGRVLGGPAQETERTRELDNTGVLKLQQETLQEQDRGLLGLLDVVRRQKTIGLAIGEELAVQNEMLEQFGEDVERVERKTGIARKRADRIS